MTTTLVYLFLISIFILFLVYLGFRVVKKKIRTQTKLPQDIEFDANLNNLDKIVDGVRKKESPKDHTQQENHHQHNHTEHHNQHSETKNHDHNRIDQKPKKQVKVKESKLLAKKAIIAKEIIDRKKDN